MSPDDVHPDEMQHDPLDAFLDDLRSAAHATPSPAIGEALTTLFRDGAAAVAGPIAAAPNRRWSMRAAVAGAVAGVTFGGLGIAGALPAPVQHGVAGVVRHVGVQLPDPETTTTQVPVTTTTVAPTRPPSATTAPTTTPRRDDDHGSDTTEPREQRRDGNGTRGRDSSGSGSSEGSGDSGTGTGDRGSGDSGSQGRSGGDRGTDGSEGRNRSSSTDVHPDDSTQAASRHIDSGGTSR